MKRTIQVLALAALVYGTQAAAGSVFPASADPEPLAPAMTYSDRHAANIVGQPFAGFPGNADPEPLAPAVTYADRHAADIAAQPFTGFPGHADWEPLASASTSADRYATERAM